MNEFTDNLTKTKGNHTIKAGVNFRFTTQWGYNDAGIYPNDSLSSTSPGNTPGITPPAGLNSTQLTNFQGLYNNLTGRVGQITQTYYSDLQNWQPAGTARVRTFVFHEYGSFIQDDWKVKRNFTLNLGLRWDFSGVPFEQNGLVGTLDQAANLNTVSQMDNLTVKKGGQWYKNDYHAFSPRIGFAWDIRGDGKTALRGNYGIFYDRIIGSATSLVDSNTPGFTSALTAYPNSGGTDLRASDNPAGPAQPAAPVLTLPATRSTSVVVFNPNLTNGYVQQWGLNLQRQLTNNTVLSVGYVGNHGLKLFMDQDLDQTHWNPFFQSAFGELATNYNAGTLANVSPSNVFVRIFGTAAAAVSAMGTSNIQTLQYGNAIYNVDVVNYTKMQAAGVSEFAVRSYPQYNELIYGTNAGLSWYNSLQVSLRRQVGALLLQANYTWSKAEDNSSQEGNGVTPTLDDFNLGLNKARSDYDHTHVFNFNSLYTLPIGRGHRFGSTMPRWANTLIGGWDLGGVWIWESGAPMTASSGRYTGITYYGASSWEDYASTNRNIGSVQLLGDGPWFFAPGTINQFSYPGLLDFGNAGRNTFRGPRFWNIDMSLVKSFALTEHKRIIFRAEAYNLFNNVDFANPSLSLATPASFGKISAVDNNPRLLQGAIRFEF